jgi:hypothetical protein
MLLAKMEILAVLLAHKTLSVGMGLVMVTQQVFAVIIAIRRAQTQWMCWRVGMFGICPDEWAINYTRL